MLTEVTAVPQAALPVDAMKDHLRLGAGFPCRRAAGRPDRKLSPRCHGGDRGADRQGADPAPVPWTLEDWRDPSEVPCRSPRSGSSA
jgi:hypothetical protein